jgi:hypothetical protein
MGRNPALRRRGESPHRSTYPRVSAEGDLTYCLARVKVKKGKMEKT